MPIVKDSVAGTDPPASPETSVPGVTSSSREPCAGTAEAVKLDATFPRSWCDHRSRTTPAPASPMSDQFAVTSCAAASRLNKATTYLPLGSFAYQVSCNAFAWPATGWAGTPACCTASTSSLVSSERP